MWSGEAKAGARLPPVQVEHQFWLVFVLKAARRPQQAWLLTNRSERRPHEREDARAASRPVRAIPASPGTSRAIGPILLWCTVVRLFPSKGGEQTSGQNSI
jgi:hypothetical protein